MAEAKTVKPEILLNLIKQCRELLKSSEFTSNINRKDKAFMTEAMSLHAKVQTLIESADGVGVINQGLMQEHGVWVGSPIEFEENHFYGPDTNRELGGVYNYQKHFSDAVKHIKNNAQKIYNTQFIPEMLTKPYGQTEWKPSTLELKVA